MKFEYHSFPPNRQTINNLNEPKKDIEFDIDVGDGYIHLHYSDLYIKFEVVGGDAGGPFTPEVNLLIILFLFYSLRLR